MVLTVDLSSFTPNSVIYDYPKYLPFLENKAIYDALCENGIRAYVDKVMPFMAVTDLDDYSKSCAMVSLLNGKNEMVPGEFESQGFLSNTASYIHSPSSTINSHPNKLDPKMITYFNAMIDTCQRRRIKVILTYAPEFDFNLQKGVSNREEIFNVIYDAAKRNDLTYLRNDSLPLCHDPKFFANNGHLNRPGANVYSYALSEQLRSLLQK
jgi:hypothetical protein